MINIEEFRQNGHKFVDWMSDYLENIADYPPKSQVNPGDIRQQIPLEAPNNSETIDTIFKDFKEIILPGMTHWQSPNFFAYFPGNGSYPSLLAEMLTATLGAQCMIWETSPAAAELEERMMEWLKDLMGIPSQMEGVIQDTASTATLCALLSAREDVTDWEINKHGFNHNLRVYASEHIHSSIDKAVKIAGIGHSNLVKVACDQNYALLPEELEKAIEQDLAAGKIPCCVVAGIGTTSTTAIDPLRPIGEICQKYNVWLHVDAAYAGTALALPEMRWICDGLEYADSLVFNPHKWMFTNFDCTAYFVKDTYKLLNTFEIMPEYLKTRVDSEVNNYRDWGIQLGRRFRALKLWFVLRNYGKEGIRTVLRNHINWAKKQEDRFEAHPDFEIMAPTPLNLVCFRYHPGGKLPMEELNKLNEKLLHELNETGKAYFTHTKLEGQYVIRWVMGNTYLEENHILAAWDLIQETAKSLS